jgi:hypothetical protein
VTLLRNIFSDLVEKRLWPLAVVLIAALFVAPNVLSKPATTEGDNGDVVRAAPGSAAALAAAAPAAQVTLDTTVPGVTVVRGAVENNPFKQQYVPKLTGPAGALVTAGSGSGKAASPVAGGGTATTTTKTVTKTTGKSKTKKTTTTAVSVTLRFGESGDLGSLPNVAAYTPLPSQDEPFFVFLGVRADNSAIAVFLVSSDAKATGDGVCKPDPTSCETIEMRAGDTEFFDVATGSGSKQYQLDVVKVVG